MLVPIGKHDQNVETAALKVKERRGASGRN